MLYQTLPPKDKTQIQPKSVRQRLALQDLAQQALSHSNLQSLFETIADALIPTLEMPHCRSWQMLSDGSTIQRMTCTENPEIQELPNQLQAVEHSLVNQVQLLQRPFRFSYGDSILNQPNALVDIAQEPPLHLHSYDWQAAFMPRDCHSGILIPIYGLDQKLIAFNKEFCR